MSWGGAASDLRIEALATGLEHPRSLYVLPNGDVLVVEIVTGFVDSDAKARGRPVGVAFDRSGALLIADDVGNTLRYCRDGQSHLLYPPGVS